MIHANAPGPRPWRARMRFAYLEPETLTYLAIPGVAITASAIKALNDNILTIKSGGSVALSSTTGRLATVALGAFIDAPSVDLRAYRGFKATFTAGGKTAVCRIGVNGTAETLGADTLLGWDLTSGWTPSGAATIDSATKFTTSANGAVTKTVANLTAGALYKTIFSGSTTATSIRVQDDSLASVWVLNAGTAYKTAQSTKTVLYNTGIGQATIATLSIERVTAPSTLGSLLYKLDGTTRSFESNDGIDPNAAWTVAIAKV